MEKPHKKLDTWKLSMELVEDVYKVSEKFPSIERFGLFSQIRRAVVSIPCNIAEGAGRNTKKEFINFLHIAQGSLSELDTQLEIAKRLGFLPAADFDTLNTKMEQISKLLTGLIKSQRAA